MKSMRQVIARKLKTMSQPHCLAGTGDTEGTQLEAPQGSREMGRNILASPFLSPSMSVLAAVTKIPSIGGLNKFISHCPADWEVQDHSVSSFRSWRDLSSWLADRCPLAISSCGSETIHLSPTSYKGTNSIQLGSTLINYLPPKGLTSEYHHIEN